MERGFNTSPGCKNGSELFREVLRRGTEYLKHPHVPHIEARVRFMMGDVYRDIVVLATGHHGDTYADSTTYKPEEAKAILRQLFLGLRPIERGRPRRVRHCNRPPTMPTAIAGTRTMLLAPSWAGWGWDALRCASGEWLRPAAKVIAVIEPSHDRHLPTKKTSRAMHDHGIPDERLYRGRTEVRAVHHLRNGPLPHAR